MIDSSWFDGSILESAGVAWTYYLIGVAGLFAFWWWLTRPIRWSMVRRVLRAVMLAAMLCPYSVAEGYMNMAPAVLMVLMETLFDGAEGFNRVGPTFLGLLGVAAVAAIIWDLLCRGWHAWRRGGSDSQPAAD